MKKKKLKNEDTERIRDCVKERERERERAIFILPSPMSAVLILRDLFEVLLKRRDGVGATTHSSRKRGRTISKAAR